MKKIPGFMEFDDAHKPPNIPKTLWSWELTLHLRRALKDKGKGPARFFGPQNISFNDQYRIYHNNTLLSLKSGGLTKFILMCQVN